MGGAVFLPDFTLRHTDGRESAVELVGFWTPEYLTSKVAKVRAARVAPLVLVVSKSPVVGDARGGAGGASGANTVLDFPMKTSLDLPDDLYRRVKSKSALEGRAVREVATALFTAWVEDVCHPSELMRLTRLRKGPIRERWLARWQALGADVAKATAGSGGLVDQLERDRR